MCKYCGKDETLIPMESGVKVPMVCSGCGSSAGHWNWKQIRRALEALETKNAALVAEINSVKAMHNGYDPECRAAMPTLKEPKSLKAAVESLLDESEGMLNAAVDEMVISSDRADRAEEMARVWLKE